MDTNLGQLLLKIFCKIDILEEIRRQEKEEKEEKRQNERDEKIKAKLKQFRKLKEEKTDNGRRIISAIGMQYRVRSGNCCSGKDSQFSSGHD